MVLALNTISGQIADVSPKMLEHPKFKDVLEVVDAEAKPYVAELYKGGSKKEKAARKPKAVIEEVIVEDEPEVVIESTEIEEEI
jgi:hypothetical protein